MKSRTEDRQQMTETQNWLASILLKHGEQIMGRFAYFYEQLAAMPRQTRRGLQKKLAMPLAGAALMLALSGAPNVHAANITVNGDGSLGTCSLADAITAANTDTATGNCIAGDAGADSIDLQTGVTLAVALPPITTVITLEGNGNTIDANSNAFSVLTIQSGGNLTLNNATITGGNTAGSGGGIYNAGTAALNNSTVSGNTADGGGGGIMNSGTATLNNSTVSGNTATSVGGGIFNSSGAIMILNNSTVTGNVTTSNNGGGLFNAPTAIATLNRSLISGNSGGGGNEIHSFLGTMNVDNSNLLGDSSNTNANAFYGFTLGASDITATSNGTMPTAIGSILNTTLANNGTQPHPFTHALVAGSPAIDQIPTTDPNCNPGTSVDQRGGARANGANQGGAACDIGAFEVSTQTPTAVSLQSISSATSSSAGGIAAAFSMISLAMGGLWLRLRGRKASA